MQMEPPSSTEAFLHITEAENACHRLDKLGSDAHYIFTVSDVLQVICGIPHDPYVNWFVVCLLNENELPYFKKHGRWAYPIQYIPRSGALAALVVSLPTELAVLLSRKFPHN